MGMFDDYLSSKGVPVPPPVDPAARTEKLRGKLKEGEAKLARLKAEPSVDFAAMGNDYSNAMGNLADKYSNTLALGVPHAIERAVAPAAHAEAERGRAQFEGEHPLLSSAMSNIAMATPVGAGGLASKIGEGAAERLGLGEVSKTAFGRFVKPVLKGAASGAAGSAEVTGVQGFMEGDQHPWRSMVESGVGGAALGGAIGVPRGIASAVKGSRGAQLREGIEAKGGTVNAGDSGSGGQLNAPQLRGLDTSDAGIGTASRRVAEEILPEHRKAFEKNVQEPFGQMKAAVDSSKAANNPRDVTYLRNKLMGLAYSERLPPPERAIVKQYVDDLDARYSSKTKKGTYAKTVMTERDLNDLREALSATAKAGAAPGTGSVRDSEFKNIAATAKLMVDHGPYGAPNEFYAKGITKYQNERNLLGHSDTPSSEPEGDIKSLTNRLARQNQDSITSGAEADDMAKFKGEYPRKNFQNPGPDYATRMELPQLLRDKGDLEFTMGTRHDGRTGLIHRALSNAAPINGRLLYRPSQFADGFQGDATGQVVNPLVQAAMAGRRRQD